MEQNELIQKPFSLFSIIQVEIKIVLYVYQQVTIFVNTIASYQTALGPRTAKETAIRGEMYIPIGKNEIQRKLEKWKK